MRYPSLVVGCLAWLIGCHSPKPTAVKPTAYDALLANRFSLFYKTLDYTYRREESRNVARTEERLKTADTTNFYRLRQLRTQTAFALKIISFAKYRVYANIGGEMEDRGLTLKNPYERARITEYLVSTNRSGEGYNLEKKINDYVAFLNRHFADIDHDGFPTMTKPDNPRNPLFGQLPELQKQDFVQGRFSGATAIEALCMLTQMQIQVLAYETTLLDTFAPEYESAN